MWANYSRWSCRWDIAALRLELGVQEPMEKIRVGVGYRLLNKGTVFLTHVVTEVRRHDTADIPYQVRCMLLNMYLYRGWANSRDHHREGVKQYAALGGAVIGVDAYDWKGFLPDRWATAAQRVAIPGQSGQLTQRNSAYNTGSGGALQGEPAVEGIAATLIFVMQSIDAISTDYAALLSGPVVPASKVASEHVLAWWQKLAGPWVGFQICLDLADVTRAWFNPEALPFVGPGAISELKAIFPGAPWDDTGMERSSVVMEAAVPFLRQLDKLMADADEASDARAALSRLQLPLPHVNDKEYWLCEQRQMKHERKYLENTSDGSLREASEWYTDVFENDAGFRNAFSSMGILGAQ